MHSKNKVHPSIIAYLDLKTEQFYKIEATADGYAFSNGKGLGRFIQNFMDV